jgi:hypothetical protein
VLVLRLAVNHDTVDGVSLDTNSMAVPGVCHGLELHLKRTVGSFQRYLVTVGWGVARATEQHELAWYTSMWIASE